MSKELIKTYRLRLSYSQEYLALKLNISQKTYSKIECGKTELRVKRLQEIAKILDVGFTDLLPPTQ